MDNHRYTSQFFGAGTLVKELDNLVKSDKGAGRWKVNHQTKSVIAQRAVFDAQLTRFIRPAQVNRLIGHNPIADLATVHYLKSIQEEASKSEIDVQKILGLAKSWKRVLHYAITPDEQKSPKPEDLDALSFLAQDADVNARKLLTEEFKRKPGAVVSPPPRRRLVRHPNVLGKERPSLAEIAPMLAHRHISAPGQ